MRPLFLTLLLLMGCAPRTERARESRQASAQPQVAPAQPRPAPAVPRADGGCTPEPPAALCAQQGRQCGRWLVTDSCGTAQQLSCGACAQGQDCSPGGRCEEACPAGQQRCCDGQCAAPSDCAVLVCDPLPAPVEQPSR